jgi:hypothetical protein
MGTARTRKVLMSERARFSEQQMSALLVENIFSTEPNFNSV